MKGNKKSIQNKLLLLSVGVVSIVIAFMMIATTMIAKMQIRKDYLMLSKNQMSILGENIKNYYENIYNNINMMASNNVIKKADNTITTYKDENIETNMNPSKSGGIEQSIYELFYQYGSTHKETQYVYLATEDGGYIAWPETTITPNYDPRERPWYKQAIEAEGEIISTESYIDANDNWVISNARALYNDNGDLIGVIGIDIYQNALNKNIAELKVGETGYYSIVNENGLVILDGQDPEKNLKYLNDIEKKEFQKILQEGNIFNHIIDGKKYISNYVDVENTKWKIFFSISKNQLRNATNKINITLGTISIGLLVIMSYIIIKGVKRVTIPIRDSAKYLTEIGKGNFDEEIKEEYLKRDDEIGIIANGIYDMRSSLMKLIHEIENELMLFKKIADENKHNYIIIYDSKRDVIYENKQFMIRNKYKNIDIMNDYFIEEIGEDKVIEIRKTIEEKGFWNGTFGVKSTNQICEGAIQEICNNKNEKYTVANIADVTEKVKSEEALLKYEKMKSHEQVRNEFFANMSHELKTPLNIFSSTMQLLELRSKEGPEELIKAYNKHKHHLGINCKRMLRLINNIVDITKLDVGFTKANFVNFDIVRLVEDITLSAVNYARQKDVNLIFDTEVEELVIQCDIDMIERVMLNLLSNAIKFTPQKGNILVDISVDLSSVHIKVKDDGIGVPVEFKESIFERFIQSDRSLNRLNEGSGIGLSIVKSLVELNGGTVSLIEGEDKGTTFEVILPNKALMKNDENQAYEVNFNNLEMEFSDIYDLY